ncbi:tetratricopeptide repeat protein [Myxosarcina sp. GI1]|uniref:tetratricopeptide repeat protein n=1 Tax=Myxosarcina sp. GI1 TaxID=1541065 RepID=UPI0012E00CDE|nr:tetratricopeptide repeat protein [Myxosarcina sp. GI1]
MLSDCAETTPEAQKARPLGRVLQQAGLVSRQQIKTALEKQEKEERRQRLGEILALQGLLTPKTADFFAERWLTIARQKSQQPIGQYFKEAGLLDESQIGLILYEQGQTNLKFGELAIRKGWIKPATRDFFVEHFTSQPQMPSVDYEHKRKIHQDFSKIRLRLFGLNENSLPLDILDEIMLWTEGQVFLTQKLCRLAVETNISVGEEKQIEQLVRTRLIENWQQGIAAEHLSEMRDRLLHNRQCQALELLREYKFIYRQQIEFDESEEQTELIDLGLVKEEEGRLRVSNRIYREVFSLSWIESNLNNLSQQSEQRDRSILDDSKTAPKITRTNLAPDAKTNRSNRWSGWLSLLIFTVFLGVSIPYILQRWQVRTLFLTSTELLTTGKYQQAIAGYNKLLNIDSNYYQAWTNRGYALSGMKKYEQMLASCSSATLIEPEAVYAWNCRGEALHNLQRNAEALEAFERAIEIAPADSIFFVNKSETLLSLKQYDEAVVASQRAIEILEARERTAGKARVAGELATAWNYQAKALLEQQQDRAALAAYNLSLEYNAEYFPAQIGKGITLSNLQQYPQASAVFENILRKDGLTKIQKAEAWFYLGKTLCNSSQVFSGIAAFDRSIELKPNYEAAKLAKARCQ